MALFDVVDLSKETCLVPLSDEATEHLEPEEHYEFASERFFMTHRAINLGKLPRSNWLLKLSGSTKKCHPLQEPPPVFVPKMDT